jgi:hypothetical protein
LVETLNLPNEIHKVIRQWFPHAESLILPDATDWLQLTNQTGLVNDYCCTFYHNLVKYILINLCEIKFELTQLFECQLQKGIIGII